MNNKVIELAEKAGGTHKRSLGVYQFYEYELLDFVKLIAQECENVDLYWLSKEDKASVLEKIKWHFGAQ
jgi:hypothetical protein